MAKKHKTHQTLHDKQKVAAAQRRNEFFNKFRYLVTALTGDPKVFKSLPESTLSFIYENRILSFRIEIAPGYDFPPQMYGYARDYVLSELQTTTRKFSDNGPEIPVDMFLSVGFTLIMFVSTIPDDASHVLLSFRSKLSMLFMDRISMLTFIETVMKEEMQALAYSISYYANVFPYILFWADYGSSSKGTYGKNVYNNFLLKCYEPQRKHFIIDGQKRPAFEICWGMTNMYLDKMALKSEDLGINLHKGSVSYPLYIQNHALNRLYERLDGVRKNLVYFWLVQSLLKKDIRKGHKNKYLIAYSIEDKKVGYLVADIQNGNILIHTFLFITNEGTPEGNLLMANTGLGKLDITYLKINKLSTFLNSDISSNPEVKKIFVEAGCTALFEELPEDIYEKSNLDEPIQVADKIRSYLANQNNDLDELETPDKAD